MRTEAMQSDKQRRANRQAIYGALLVWIATHFAHLLKPLGVPPFVSQSLLYAALIALPALALWPWVRDLLLDLAKEEEEPNPQQNQFMDKMINFEILVLSIMLILLLLFGRHVW